MWINIFGESGRMAMKGKLVSKHQMKMIQSVRQSVGVENERTDAWRDGPNLSREAKLCNARTGTHENC